jgi:hypothetical protein
MSDAAMLVELLKAEIEALKATDPTLDWSILDRLHASVATDVYMDEMYGPRIDDQHNEMHALLEEADNLGREVQAFMAAGVRAFQALEARLPAR